MRNRFARLLLPVFLLTFAGLVPSAAAADPHLYLDDPGCALVIIDIQDFYFPGGGLPLVEPEAAAAQAGRLLAAFREHGRTVVHVGHVAQSGAEFDEAVAPREGETVVMKTQVNAFRDTDLQQKLEAAKIKRLVLCGMQTHMCLEGAVRAAADLGYECVVVGDACATRDLARAGVEIPAAEVHQSTLATLDGAYAAVRSTDGFLDGE